MPQRSGCSDSNSVIDSSASMSMVELLWMYGIYTFLPCCNASRTIPAVDSSPLGMERYTAMLFAFWYSASDRSLFVATLAATVRQRPQLGGKLTLLDHGVCRDLFEDVAHSLAQVALGRLEGHDVLQ